MAFACPKSDHQTAPPSPRVKQVPVPGVLVSRFGIIDMVRYGFLFLLFQRVFKHFQVGQSPLIRRIPAFNWQIADNQHLKHSDIIAYEFFVSLSIGVSLHTVNGGKDVLQSLAISKRLSHKSGFCHVLHSRGHRVPTSGLPPNRQDNQEAPLDPRTSQRI